MNTPKGAHYVGKFSRKGGDEVAGGATSKILNYNKPIGPAALPHMYNQTVSLIYNILSVLLCW